MVSDYYSFSHDIYHQIGKRKQKRKVDHPFYTHRFEKVYYVVSTWLNCSSIVHVYICVLMSLYYLVVNLFFVFFYFFTTSFHYSLPSLISLSTFSLYFSHYFLSLLSSLSNFSLFLSLLSLLYLTILSLLFLYILSLSFHYLLFLLYFL